MGIEKEDQLLFKKACKKICGVERTRDSIGILSEKTVHAVLKNYLVPNEDWHEIKCGRYVADIFYEGEIIEIQTAGFDKLRKKLNAFLPDYHVTVVYPVPYEKRLFWIDEETGEVKDQRKSPKKGSKYDCFSELYKIKQYIKDPHFHLRIILMNVEEYRLLNGWSKDKKKGSVRHDRIPVDLVDDIFINNEKDYSQFFPEKTPEEFTSKDYKKHTKLTIKNARTALNVLYYMNAVERIGKTGNNYIYKIK